MASVGMQNVSKTFRASEQYRSVYGIDFEVRDGEFFCFFGPTNSGKTEILRFIAGLEKPDSGVVLIGNRNVNDIDPSQRMIAMLFETLALYPNRNGFDNIASPLRIKKVPRMEIRERVMEVVKLLRIEHLVNRTPETYSGGEKQRVALGRVFVQEHNVYLLDEPLGGLDARLRIAMRSELKRIQRDLGQTMILASHDQDEVMSMGDRIVVLCEGRIQQIGTPQVLYNQPVNFWVAKSLGKPSMNFYPCILKLENEKVLAVHEHFRLNVQSLLKTVGEAPQQGEILLGIRPEDIDINEAKTTEEDIAASVYITEQLGDKTIADFKLGEETVRTIVSAEKHLRIDDVRFIRFRKEKIHIFEKRTGVTIV
jgi:multiple sugar transport system ATP-binding protein